ncbi:hypothetical protein HanPSC8_Chr17g0759741 [Helianthus annuus]|nr:hypothetical protein HanPSC8_Chr17g0759741 [Helianthus annuus]
MLELKPLRIQPSNLVNFVTLDNRKAYANFYTRNPLFMFTTFWGVTCFTIKLHLNLFFMQCTKQSLYMNTML